MKRTLKSFSAIACFTLIAFTSCYLPGSDQYKIKSATADYVSARLNKGEKYQWGHLERKNGCHYDGKDCKYADKEWNSKKYPSAEEVKELIKQVVK